MLCARCGASNPPESTFCGGCGVALAPTPNVQPAAPGFSEQVPPAVSSFNSPAPVQTSMPAIQDEPTLRIEPGFVPQQPAPSVNELFNHGAPAQNMPEPPASPSPEFPGGTYAGQTPPAPTSPSGTEYSLPASAAPAFSSGAAYPAVGATPGSPGGAAYPGAGGMFGYPGGTAYSPQASVAPAFTSGAYPPVTPFAIGVYPGQPSQSGWSSHADMAHNDRPPDLKYIQPLPVWVTIVSSIIVASVLVSLMFFIPPDWAAGLQISGIVALVLGLLVLTAFGIRAVLGMLAETNPYRKSQIINAIVLVGLLFGYGIVGVTSLGQDVAHNLQGHVLESRQQWQGAINEYQEAGQAAPNSTDLARTYTEWGQHLLKQPDYQGALNKFSAVITSYKGVTDQVKKQAQQGAIQAYQALGKQAIQQARYDVAVQQFSILLNQTYCDQACRASISPLEATAYFHLGEQKLAAQDYTAAANAFKHLTSDNNLKHSPEAKKVHGDYAKALLAEGKQALSTTCASAVPIYQQLAQDFSDTPEGQTAAQALNGPVTVKGHFTSPVPPASTAPFVFLGTKTFSAQPTFGEFTADFNSSPHTVIHSDGTFLFTDVHPGSYQFVYGTLNNTDNLIHFFPSPSNTIIGQLCYNFGDINDPIPTA